MEGKNITVKIDVDVNVSTAEMKNGLGEVKKQACEALIGSVRDFEIESKDEKEVSFTISMPETECFETLQEAVLHIEKLKQQHGDDVHIVQLHVVNSFIVKSSNV